MHRMMMMVVVVVVVVRKIVASLARDRRIYAASSFFS